MSFHVHAYPTPGEAAAACSRHILARLEDTLSGESTATLAISGGSTPKLLFKEFVESRFDWERVHVFWVDERAVPPTDARSNYRLAEEHFLQPAHVPLRNVHRIHAELRPEVAAEHYTTEIREFFNIAPGEMPHFDVIHRGIGADAHTASLFPGEPLIDDREGICAAVFVDKLAQWRITLLPGVLLAARHSVILATGEDKAETIRSIFEDPYDPKRLPAQMISHHGRGVTWFLDEAAARRGQ